jgi:hypothetical protein
MLLKLVHYVELHISQIEKIIVIYCKITNYFIYKTLNFVALHEKLFIVFMASSLMHMLACIKGIRWVAETNNDIKSVQKGLLIKQSLLIISLASTIGLVGFFLKHRLLCHDMGELDNLIKKFTYNLHCFFLVAFSWFAFCEYVVALANMAFHITVILDFPTEHLVVARGLKHITALPLNHKFD